MSQLHKIRSDVDLEPVPRPGHRKKYSPRPPHFGQFGLGRRVVTGNLAARRLQMCNRRCGHRQSLARPVESED